MKPYPLCAKLPRLQDLKKHFRRWRQEEVAKIIHCGEHYFPKTEVALESGLLL